MPLPFGATVETQLASSFVNRVSPANVGGMALNVRYLQKVGVDPAEAVTGVGLNSLVGGIVHVVLMVAFLAWAGRGGGLGFSIPSTSKVLVVLAVVARAPRDRVGDPEGEAADADEGGRVPQSIVAEHHRPWPACPRSWRRCSAGRSASPSPTSPRSAAAVAAFDGGISIAQVGAVYLGASIVASAAPTPGGLGAMEAALVAGFTGVGLDPGTAVAAVLAYRLLTYWVPILPGWLSFRQLDRRGLI